MDTAETVSSIKRWQINLSYVAWH